LQSRPRTKIVQIRVSTALARDFRPSVFFIKLFLRALIHRLKPFHIYCSFVFAEIIICKVRIPRSQWDPGIRHEHFWKWYSQSPLNRQRAFSGFINTAAAESDPRFQWDHGIVSRGFNDTAGSDSAVSLRPRKSYGNVGIFAIILALIPFKGEP
jgi:hypothetical protein